MKSYLIGGFAMIMCALAACDKPAAVTPDPGPDPIIEPEQSIYELRSPYYVNSNLVYYGDDGDTGISDWWVLTLYTDMEVQAGGYPEGPGQIISLSLNASCSPDGTPDTGCLVGSYREQSNSGDFSAGSFMPGYIDRVDLPDGVIEMPVDSYYGDIPAGTTGFEPVLIIEGSFTIELLESGQHRIQGVLVGDDYRKYYVYYIGILNPVDRSSGGSDSVANSNLTSDITLDGFTQAALHDYGDSYMTGEQTYRKFVLFLAEDGVDLSGQWPKGSGKLLRAEFFVPYEANVEDGIPQNNYVPVKITETGGILKTDMVPGKFVPGTPDKFSYSTGTWYQELAADGSLTQYARITGGVIGVARDGDSHAIKFELLDCSDPAYTVSCIWESTDPIPTADYAFD